MRKEGKRREWVKHAAILFLVLLLILTFFSNTMMNNSLAEVEVNQVSRENIVTEVRGSGVVEAGELYKVILNEPRMVTGVSVKEGDKVTSGDVLLSFEPKENENLEVAISTRNQLQYECEKLVIENGISVRELENLEQNSISFTDLHKKLDNMQDGPEKDLFRKKVITLLDLAAKREALAQQIKLVQKLENDSSGTEYKAPVSGIVTQVSCVAGEMTVAGSEVMEIQVEGKASTVRIPVTEEQASMVEVGERAKIKQPIDLKDVPITVASIDADETNPYGGRILSFTMEETVKAGEGITLSVEKSNAEYDMVIAEEAIREDRNGTFVYVVEAKSSPLGNRYRAVRVSVTVVASDGIRAAITGGITNADFIITTASGPVSNGQQVRITE